MKQFLGIVIFFFILISQTSAQCTLSDPIPIADQSQNTLGLNISNLVNDDLASPGQGICGVLLEFRHTFIGDLTIELISPSGQTVELVGPAVNGRQTDFSAWNVTFLPCSQPVNPDPGLGDQWDNADIWGIGGNYNGSYHPSNGCLEDFNSGFANGLWRLTITDNDLNDVGQFISFTLIFCDPTGLDCVSCLANAGEFSSTNYTHCNNVPVSLDLTPEFNGNEPNTDYSYQYALFDNNQLTSLTDTVIIDQLAFGSYTICGLSVLTSQLTEASNFPSGFDKQAYLDFLDNQNLCSQLSSDCIEVQIFPDNPVEDLVLKACPYTPAEYDGQEYTVSDTILITYEDQNGCDSSINLIIDKTEFQITIVQEDTLFCDTDNVQLVATDFLHAGLATYEWRARDGGIIVGPTDQLICLAAAPGKYVLRSWYNDCYFDRTVLLKADYIKPNISYIVDSASCNTPTVELRGFVDVASDMYLSVNGQIVDTGVSFSIDPLAFNQLIAIRTAHCKDTVDIIIPLDTIKPQLILRDTSKNCPADILGLLADGNPNWSYVWTSPLGNSTNDQLLLSDEDGLFDLQVIDNENGCENSYSLNVTTLDPHPEITIVSDSFDCSGPPIQMTVSSNLDEQIFSITGANVTANGHSAEIDGPGLVNIHIETILGCVYDSVWSPPFKVDTDTFDFTFDNDTFFCNPDTIQLRVITSETIRNYIWRGPNDFISGQASPSVSLHGIYTLTMQTQNGCVLRAVTEAVLDTVGPIIVLNSNETINCARDSVLPFIEDDKGYIYSWSGPSNFSSSETRPLLGQVGAYRVTVTKTNGCQAVYPFAVKSDFNIPTFDFNGDALDCTTNQTIGRLNTNADSIAWLDGTTIISNADTAILPAFKSYDIYLKGLNGCESIISYTPPVDTLSPIVTIDDAYIGCTRDTSIFVPNSNIGISEYNWTGPVGFGSDQAMPTVENPGTYTLVATAINGCRSQTTANLIEDLTLPIVSIIGTPNFNCNVQSRVFEASANVLVSDFIWTLPNNQNVLSNTITVDELGWLSVTAEGRNSCFGIDSVEIVNAMDPPLINLTFDTINCVNDSFHVSINPLINSRIQWTGPMSIPDNTRNLVTLTEGQYFVLVTDNETGCESTAGFRLFSDLRPVENEIIGDQVINCSNPMITLSSNTIESDVENIWTTANTGIITADSIDIEIPGTYYLLARRANGCFDLDSIEINIDTIHATVTLFGDSLDCNEAKANLGYISNFDDLDVSWTGPNFIATDSVITVISGGMFHFMGTRPNGCMSIDSQFVLMDTIRPFLDIEFDLFSCDDTTATVRAISNSTIDRIIWISASGSSFEDNPLTINEPGIYKTQAFGENGCRVEQTFSLIEFDLITDVQLDSDTINCIENTVTHEVQSSSTIVDYEWLHDGAIQSQANSLQVDDALPISLSLTNTKGCTWDSTFTTAIDTISPKPMIIQYDPLICLKNTANLLLNNLPSNLDYTYFWSSIDGQIESNIDTDSLLISSEGNYVVSVLNVKNGCIGADELTINIEISDLFLEDYKVIQANCFTEFLGQIIPGNQNGGSTPYLFELNGQTAEFGDTLKSIPPGAHLFSITDQYGCEDEVLVEINDVVEYYLNVGQDTSIQLGTSIIIRPNTNITADLIQSNFWSSTDSILCFDCDDLSILPLQTSTYTYQIIDTNNCVYEDSKVVEVLVKKAVYMPNAFSPNNDNINDIIHPFFGRNVAEVLTYQIYDRWGNKVFGRKNYSITNQINGWNGEANGKIMDPQVFSYFLEIRLLNDQIISQKGEFYLIK